MSGPLYVPVLPTRPHAADAYRRLRPDIQNAVAPLWTLPPRHGVPRAAVTADIRGDLALVVKSQRYCPAWIDAPFADETEASVFAELLPEVCSLGPLRPVTGPSRPEAQQTAVLTTARLSGNPLGIRVQVPGEWESGMADSVSDLLTRVGSAVRVDLLLDLAAVRADRPDAGKETLRALDALVPLGHWRTVAVLAGGFPQVTADMLEDGPYEESRMDWQVWNEVRAGGRGYARALSYGDYGIQPVAAISHTPRPRKGGPPWGVLRYTTDSSFILGKMLARGADRVAYNRSVARQIVDHHGFRGAAAGSAEAWIRACADDLCAGTGNFTTWLWVGNAQHMTYVVHSLRR
ncbi:hypothetical protein ACFRKB_29740 [Streptomyces scopuliridis]|uniref:beta family protein n=1 Tax=Streptomyces scopuliridis TaxID=452529 RepID=UPI0036C3BEC1